MDDHAFRLDGRKRHSAQSPFVGWFTLLENPYKTPPRAERPQEDSCLTPEGRLNLAFAASISHGLSFFCAAAAVYAVYSLITNLCALAFEFDGWTWLHYLEIVRGLFIPALVILSWFLRQLTSSLRELSNSECPLNQNEVDVHIKRGTWVLIGVSLFAAVSVLEIAARYSMIYFEYASPY